MAPSPYEKRTAPWNKSAARARQKNEVEQLMKTVAMPVTIIADSFTGDMEAKKQQSKDETNQKTSTSTFSVGEVYLRIRDEKAQKEVKKSTMTVHEYLEYRRIKAEKEWEAEREQIEILKQLAAAATRLRENEIAVAAEKKRVKKWNEEEGKTGERITFLVEMLRELNLVAEEKQRQEYLRKKVEGAERITALVERLREYMKEKEQERERQEKLKRKRNWIVSCEEKKVQRQRHYSRIPLGFVFGGDEVLMKIEGKVVAVKSLGPIGSRK